MRHGTPLETSHGAMASAGDAWRFGAVFHKAGAVVVCLRSKSPCGENTIDRDGPSCWPDTSVGFT